MVDDINETSLNFVQLRLNGRIQVAVGCVDQQRAGAKRGIGYDLELLHEPKALCNLSDDGARWQGPSGARESHAARAAQIRP
jgi:hypothetical protein